ncbi:dephospho-CoA kinase [Variovorax terrae]|uniref:Dephospho-CoA kinase n=1 Tax=Variovorax terrae TaxID=2923278 RepID=A0A9X1VZR6_9BURK|nr:dephospho-CoA kinase [Variovorax terrae]MCJ0765047.1 dephospho-CoA kinase [Variovorax terrae]
MKAALKLGLTGGIGSGKSTVAGMLAELGAAVIDADAIARSVTAAGGGAIVPIAAEFGSHFITAQGAMDRDRMREQAYVDATARRRLEAIIHPLVGRETARQAEAALQAGHRCLVFDVPLLVESGRWRQQVDRVLVVDCEPETQIRRVMERSALARDAVERIIAAQAGRAQRLAAADAVICNEGLSFASLRTEVGQIAQYFGL